MGQDLNTCSSTFVRRELSANIYKFDLYISKLTSSAPTLHLRFIRGSGKQGKGKKGQYLNTYPVIRDATGELNLIYTNLA